MIYPRISGALALAFVPATGQAHEAFGDLGPFYGGLLHPLVDPRQGLLLVALAVLLARQPRQSVQFAYAAVVICAVAAAVLVAFSPAPAPGIRSVGLIVGSLGLLAVIGKALPRFVVVALSAALAGVATLATDMPNSPRAVLLAATGTALGISLLVLLVWVALDLLQERVGRIAGAVAGSWVAAIGVMAAALPAVAI